MKKPIAKKKSLILGIPSDQIKLGSQELDREVLAEVKYMGSEVDKSQYKVGDIVLFDKNKATEIKYFHPTIYWKTHEDYIICGIE